MANEELEIEISPNGKVTVRSIGIKGPRCVDAAEMVARIIGNIESQQLTTEYHEVESEVRHTIDLKQRW